MKIHLYIEEHKVCLGKLGRQTDGVVSRRYLCSSFPYDMLMEKAEKKYRHLVRWDDHTAFILQWHNTTFHQ